MSDLIPKEMHPNDIAAILRDMATGVESGDTLEGSIEFIVPTREDPGYDETRDYRLVRGTYRIGNLMGQGGVRMIGDVPPARPDGDTG